MAGRLRENTLARWLGGIAFVGLAALAIVFATQAPERRTELLVEFGKGLIQLMLIGVLGTVLKLVADAHQDARSRAQQREDFRADKTRRLVEATNTIRRAWILVEANRSVKTWSEQMLAVVDAGFDLRVVNHQILDSSGAADPPLPGSTSADVAKHIDAMLAYVDWVEKDFREQEPLGDEEVDADERDIDPAQRSRRQREIWNSISKLPSVADALERRDVQGRAVGPSWKRYEEAYSAALQLMTQASFAAIARTYETVRATWLPGPTRTIELERIVREARRQATGAAHTPAALIALYRSREEGKRIQALAVAQDYPDAELTDMVRDAIEKSCSAFEQYHALVAASRVAPKLDMRQRPRLGHFLERQLERNKYLREASDRRSLAVRILRELSEESPSGVSP